MFFPIIPHVLLNKEQLPPTLPLVVPNGTRLASSGRGKGSGELFVWDAQSGKLVRAFAGHPRVIYAVARGHNGDMVTGGSDGMLRWWNVHSGECTMVRQGHRGTIRSLRKLASCGDDGTINVWDIKS